MATRLTLQLPAAAAAKLAAMTPAQMAELSALLGYEVQSVSVHPNEATRRKHVNHALASFPVYHDAVPWDAIDAVLSANDFNPVSEADVMNGSRDGRDNRLHVKVGPNTWLLVTWYRMTSGRYEVVAYVS